MKLRRIAFAYFPLSFFEMVPNFTKRLKEIWEDNGVCQSFTSDSNAMPVAVTPDVLYEITVHYNPWLMSAPDKTVFKVDRSGQLFLADEDGQLYEVSGSDIIIEFTPIGSIDASFAS
ncbi:MAG: hypothetical protein ACOX36_05185 [Saccharofermentanales bacterium]|jgi:hypothetical protein|nr:hypothetical protein [Clostridiaceae bacterium]